MLFRSVSQSRYPFALVYFPIYTDRADKSDPDSQSCVANLLMKLVASVVDASFFAADVSAILNTELAKSLLMVDISFSVVARNVSTAVLYSFCFNTHCSRRVFNFVLAFSSSTSISFVAFTFSLYMSVKAVEPICPDSAMISSGEVFARFIHRCASI